MSVSTLFTDHAVMRSFDLRVVHLPGQCGEENHDASFVHTDIERFCNRGICPRADADLYSSWVRNSQEREFSSCTSKQSFSTSFPTGVVECGTPIVCTTQFSSNCSFVPHHNQQRLGCIEYMYRMFRSKRSGNYNHVSKC
eukprot:TRINITY_DN9721_c0_g1_i1.p1 TRINITY_DN9721_c0_g1~~TRINITY_DN9721_c0_g1_i1.p1  ORF type:complete len:140 (+),score=10.62 TRINITY_DN9721_c0_g1_i1:133-552(+)